MEIAVSLAYPIADLVLLGLIVGALAGTGWQLDRTWVLLAGGVATFWLADSLYLVRTADGTYESGNWFEIGWWLGLVMIAAAAWQPVRRTRAARARRAAAPDRRPARLRRRRPRPARLRLRSPASTRSPSGSPPPRSSR